MDALEIIIVSVILFMLILCLFWCKKSGFNADGFNADGIETKFATIDRTLPIIQNTADGGILVPDSMSYAYRLDKPHYMYRIPKGMKPLPVSQLFDADYVSF